MLWSGQVMHLAARRAAEFGVEIEGPVRFRMEKAVARKDAIVRKIHEGIYGALRKRDDRITFLRGAVRFLGDHEVDTGDARLSFAKAIIATGARRSVAPIAGLDTVEFLTNRSALELDHVPESLIVIGAGYVGIEFAQMYARFGARVTLLGKSPRLAPGEDPELSDLLATYLRDEGIDVQTGAAVSAVRAEAGQQRVSFTVGGKEHEASAAALLVATGRVGNTDDLGLGEAGIEVETKGFIPVDDQLRTSQPHIWAIGDVKGGLMFTHVATYDGPIAALNAVKDQGKTVDYRVVPRAVFSDPTLASVGLNEDEARERGYDIAVGKVPAGGARAMAIGDTRGMLKAIVNRADQQILGFHILAPNGDDLLHEAVAAMYDHGSIDRIGKSIHVHPTLSEMVKSAAKAAK